MLLDRIPLSGPMPGLGETASLDQRDHTVAIGQDIDLRRPRPILAEGAVDEHDSMSAASFHVCDREETEQSSEKDSELRDASRAVRPSCCIDRLNPRHGADIGHVDCEVANAASSDRPEVRRLHGLSSGS